METNVYRIAFDEANSELNEIVGRFEKLRQHKERVEKVLAALKPLIEMQAQTVAG
jgi:hypothetical protein